jgi:hypothetical protein
LTKQTCKAKCKELMEYHTTGPCSKDLQVIRNIFCILQIEIFFV